MVMQAISLCDTVTAAEGGSGFHLLADGFAVPGGKKSLEQQAAEAFFAAIGRPMPPLTVHLKKVTPAYAGLGGGSADAAALLRCLRRQYAPEMTTEELRAIGLTVGSDVPFCVSGGTALAEGRGERLTMLPGLPDCRIVLCKPEESMEWFRRLWQNTVDFFRTLDIPVRTLECCSGDLADLKVKSLDVEAWSPRQQKYFEVGSCSNLGDAQARRLQIRVKGDDGQKYFAHTLNNTVVAPPRMLIAFLENNLQADGTIRIPEALRMYMGGKDHIG